MQKDTETTKHIVPATDILEMDDGFHILMDLPGVGADGLAIDLEENELTIRGTSAYTPVDKGNAVHLEFDAVPYARTFTLSDIVDRERIKATLRDGQLDLFLPKAEAAKPRRIEIRTA